MMALAWPGKCWLRRPAPNFRVGRINARLLSGRAVMALRVAQEVLLTVHRRTSLSGAFKRVRISHPPSIEQTGPFVVSLKKGKCPTDLLN